MIVLAFSVLQPGTSETLKKIIDESVAEARWPSDKVSATMVDVRDRTWASHRGDTPYYPASVIKAAYMGAVFEWAREKKLEMTPEVEQDLKLMIGPSSNVACQRIVDRLTGTEAGPALEGAAYVEFAERRNAVNRWLRGLGLENVDACQKTWDELPAGGREVQFLRGGTASGPFANRNSMTTDDTALLFLKIATDAIVDAPSCAKMRELMARDLNTYPDDKVRALGGAPEGSKVWAKAGWISTVNHEAAIIELPDGRRFVQVVFTQAKNYRGPFIADFTRAVCRRLAEPVR